ITGVACFLMALPVGLIAMLFFSHLGTVDRLGSFLISSLIAILAIGLMAAGRFLVTAPDSSWKKVLPVMVVAIFAGIVPSAWLLWKVSHVDSFNTFAAARSQMQQMGDAISAYKE